MPENNDRPETVGGSALRPLLIAAILIASGLTLLQWDESRDRDSTRTPVQISQNR